MIISRPVGEIRMKTIRYALALAGLVLWPVAGHAAAGPVYSLHQLHQAGIMPEGTAVHLHALVYQGEHALIMLDERCPQSCDDVLGLDVPPKAAASYGAAERRLIESLGCCGERKAYFDMIVKVHFLDHGQSPGAKNAHPVRLLSEASLVRIIRAVSDTPAHWLATHR
jgi:hypothetical protein